MKNTLVLLIAVAFACPAAVSQQLSPAVSRPDKNPTCSTNSWSTPAEESCYRTTPRYAETMAYIARITAAQPQQVKLETFGKTGEGRNLVAVIVSKDGVFDPATLHRDKRPILLVQNSIHAGEMDGKDSSLALLRDMVITRTKAALLDRAVVIFIPIYNADGHERFGPYNRINQNGPEEMGWRTQARNLNLNRDYLKADAPETRALLRLINEWLPDFFVDNHVTDGADYQYDTTYSLDTGPDVFPATAEWQLNVLEPYLQKSVTDAGHVIGPMGNTWMIEDGSPEKGFTMFSDTPRYSTGYFILQNRPAMLVEMHMLKDYKTRVTGNYEIMRALLEVLNRDGAKLVDMNQAADAATIAAASHPAPFPLQLAASAETEPFLYRGYQAVHAPSPISGTDAVSYTHEPLNITAPRHAKLAVKLAIVPPRAYIVPAQWTPVIDVLQAHGLKLQRTTRAWTSDFDTYRCKPPKWQERSFEGRQIVAGAGEFSMHSGQLCTPVHGRLSFPPGSVVVPLDQRAAKVAIHWLEPDAPDSAVTWGFFNAIFEQKEYGEGYVLEKLAREMIAKDPSLKKEFEDRVATDKAFAADPRARLNFFFQHSPWWDRELGLYPVGRLQSLTGVPMD